MTRGSWHSCASANSRASASVSMAILALSYALFIPRPPTRACSAPKTMTPFSLPVQTEGKKFWSALCCWSGIRGWIRWTFETGKSGYLVICGRPTLTGFKCSNGEWKDLRVGRHVLCALSGLCQSSNLLLSEACCQRHTGLSDCVAPLTSFYFVL